MPENVSCRFVAIRPFTLKAAYRLRLGGTFVTEVQTTNFLPAARPKLLFAFNTCNIRHLKKRKEKPLAIQAFFFFSSSFILYLEYNYIVTNNLMAFSVGNFHERDKSNKRAHRPTQHQKQYGSKFQSLFRKWHICRCLV